MGTNGIPRRMRVVAWVCILLGTVALARTSILLARGVVSLDPAALLPLAAIALLLGRIRFRIFIGFYIAFTAALAIVGLLLVLTRSLDRIVIAGLAIEAWPGAVIALILVVALATAAFWALYTAPRSGLGTASREEQKLTQ